MAIYGIGANYDGDDVSWDFIKGNFVATGWDLKTAPDLHEYFLEMRAGDIVYLKSCSFSSNIMVKGIGIVLDEAILGTYTGNPLIQIGRNVKWIHKDWFRMLRPVHQKNNVRGNTIYREFHPDLIDQVMNVVNLYL